MYNKLNLVCRIGKLGVYKFQKEGTKRTFFAPEFEGKRINSVMYARLYDAEKLAKVYVKNHIEYAK
jgi:hypothetical protein